MKKLLHWIDSLFYRYALSRVIKGLPKASWMSNDTHNEAVTHFVENQVARINLEYEAGGIDIQERHDRIRLVWKLEDNLWVS